jgi:hypothetical protein
MVLPSGETTPCHSAAPGRVSVTASPSRDYWIQHEHPRPFGWRCDTSTAVGRPRGPSFVAGARRDASRRAARGRHHTSNSAVGARAEGDRLAVRGPGGIALGGPACGDGTTRFASRRRASSSRSHQTSSWRCVCRRETRRPRARPS